MRGVLGLGGRGRSSVGVAGGATAVILNGFLAARLLQPSRDESARAMMRSAWFGEIGKVLLTGLLFGVIFGFVRPMLQQLWPCSRVSSRHSS